jgi:hypothetical protein
VEKVLYVVWRAEGPEGDDLGGALRGPVADRLLRDGARGVQINVADADVAAATLRFELTQPPMAAVVGVWVDSARDAARRPLDDALLASPAVANLAAYLVTESVPLRNSAHPPAPGERTAGFANMAFLQRPAALAHADWLDFWLNGHTPAALELQSTFAYTQNVVSRVLTEGAPPFDGIVEECFPMEALTDLHAFFAAADDDELARRMTAMAASTGRFIEDNQLDVLPTSQYVIKDL